MKQYTFGFPQIINRSSKKIELSSNVKSINECLGILLRTRPGELLGDPLWGCNLINRIFQYQGAIIEPLIIEDILQAVSKYEPRIIMSSENIRLTYDATKLQIYITYIIKETGEINEYNLEISTQDNPDRIA